MSITMNDLSDNPFALCQHSKAATLIRNQQVIGSSPIVGSKISHLQLFRSSLSVNMT
jgi:hypothetical protein